jgi:hypothetical protein
VSVAISVLTACGGGSTSNETEARHNDVKVDLSGLNIETSNLTVSTGEVSKLFNEKLDFNLTKTQKAIVGVFKDNQPVLLGRKIAGENKVEVSLESSAEIFVLYHPRFNGVESNNQKELSHRIRSNQKFNDLVGQLQKEINNGNPCPMSPVCSPKVAVLAFEIAEDLNISDLYEQ